MQKLKQLFYILLVAGPGSTLGLKRTFPAYTGHTYEVLAGVNNGTGP